MSEREEKRGGAGCAIGCVLMFLVAPVLYVLSLGPAAYLITRNPRFEWLGVIYTPLEWLASWKPLGDALSWYVDLWAG